MQLRTYCSGAGTDVSASGLDHYAHLARLLCCELCTMRNMPAVKRIMSSLAHGVDTFIPCERCVMSSVSIHSFSQLACELASSTSTALSKVHQRHRAPRDIGV